MILSPKILYLNVISVLMYFANNMRPNITNITFGMNLLARYSSIAMWRHWKRVKDMLHYLHRTTDMSLFYPRCFYLVSKVSMMPNTCLILIEDDLKLDIYTYTFSHNCMAISLCFIKKNTYSYFIKSCWNSTLSWSKSRILVIEIYNWTYTVIMQIVIGCYKCYNNLWRQH